MDNNGVYTVDLVDINAGLNKVGQSADTTRGAGGANDVIDYKHNSTTDGYVTPANRVYGNDKSVYITASVDKINTSSSRSDLVIDDVDNVAVGIDNVDVTPWNSTHSEITKHTLAGGGRASSGIYTLYDDDGYIIAMVIVGEDNGNASGLVYIHSSSVYREAYDKETKLYTWTRTAIVDGEEVTLTEVDDTRVSMLSQMDKNFWYQVRYNSKGEVVKTFAESTHTGYPDYTTKFPAADHWNIETGAYRYVYDYTGNNINNAINTAGVKTVLYHENFPNVIPRNEGKTLYMTQGNDAYIRFTDDTKVVFEQNNNNKWFTNFWTGESGVDKVIKALHDDPTLAAGRKNYNISAVIEDGRATSIIIRDNVLDGNGGTPPTGNANYSLTTAGSVYTLHYHNGSYNDSNTAHHDAVLDMIMADLTSKGYSNFNITHSGTVYTVSGVDSRGVTRSFTWDSASASNIATVNVTIDSKPMTFDVGTTVSQAAVAAGTPAANVGTYAKISNSSGGFLSYAVVSAPFGLATDGQTIETGYYSKPASVTGSGWFNSGYTIGYSNSGEAAAMKSGQSFDVTFTNGGYNVMDQTWLNSLTITANVTDSSGAAVAATCSAVITNAGDGAGVPGVLTVTVTVNGLVADIASIVINCA